MGGMSSLNPAYRQAGGMYWMNGIVGKFLMNETERCLLSIRCACPGEKATESWLLHNEKTALL